MKTAIALTYTRRLLPEEYRADAPKVVGQKPAPEALCLRSLTTPQKNMEESNRDRAHLTPSSQVEVERRS